MDLVRTRIASLPFQVGIGIGEVTIGCEHRWAVNDRTQRVNVQELNLIRTSSYLRAHPKTIESIDTASADPIIHLPHSQKPHNFYYADD
jgi:hypothetical protein